VIPAVIAETIGLIAPVDTSFEAAARARLDSLTKPPGSLGRLEDLAARVAVIQHDVRPRLYIKAVVLMAADHGVTAQGVSPYPSEVTAQMVENFMAGGAAICQLADHAGANLILVDVGVDGDLKSRPQLLQSKVARGTKDLSLGPAMTREETAEAMLTGVRVAQGLAGDGTGVIATGEMGIGNTTAAAALTCALTGADPADVVGPGTGLDAAGVAHKVDVVRRALEVNAGAIAAGPFDALAAVGGLEIAGLAGVVIGAASAGIPVIADGFISGAAALAAVRMAPDSAGYLFTSHRSAEPGHRVVLEALGIEPVLDLDMRLGEGTGATLAMEIIDAACVCMSGMATFGEAGVSGSEDA
jgi:nicotinate-nucleotide--dimethylbenzimidazole phosphoribosyltransferase